MGRARFCVGAGVRRKLKGGLFIFLSGRFPTWQACGKPAVAAPSLSPAKPLFAEEHTTPSLVVARHSDAGPTKAVASIGPRRDNASLERAVVAADSVRWQVPQPLFAEQGTHTQNSAGIALQVTLGSAQVDGGGGGASGAQVVVVRPAGSNCRTAHSGRAPQGGAQVLTGEARSVAAARAADTEAAADTLDGTDQAGLVGDDACGASPLSLKGRYPGTAAAT